MSCWKMVIQKIINIIKGWYFKIFNKNEKLAKKRISICNNCNSKEHIEIIGDICN
jgi:hypothetical protein